MDFLCGQRFLLFLFAKHIFGQGGKTGEKIAGNAEI